MTQGLEERQGCLAGQRLERYLDGHPDGHRVRRDTDEPGQQADALDIPTLIETLSAGITLLPGDIIATGTPAGIGIGFDPQKFLVSGDVVEVSITRLGTIRNRVA